MTESVPENDVLHDKEFLDYKKNSVRFKFLSQLFGVISGATFIGVAGKVASVMLESAAASHSAAIAAFLAKVPFVMGFAAISIPTAIAFVAIGILCTYFAQKFSFEGQILDMKFGAKFGANQTARALGAKKGTELVGTIEGPEINPKPVTIPGMPMTQGMVTEQLSVAEETRDAKWTPKFSKSDPAQDWVTRTQTQLSNDNTVPKRA